MAISDLLWEIPLTIIGGGAGLVFHELCHYITGHVSGGEPTFDRWWYGLPTMVSFENPKAMGDIQVRITGGVVVLWPILTFLLAGYIFGTGAKSLFPLVVFFGGASVVSWTDLFAASRPKMWKRFAAGEEISLDEME